MAASYGCKIAPALMKKLDVLTSNNSFSRSSTLGLSVGIPPRAYQGRSGSNVEYRKQ